MIAGTQAQSSHVTETRLSSGAWDWKVVLMRQDWFN